MSKRESAATAVRTFTVVPLDVGEQKEVVIEADSILDVPVIYVGPAMILHNVRHGELSILGDRRRWFLHQLRYERYDGIDEERFIIVTADKRQD